MGPVDGGQELKSRGVPAGVSQDQLKCCYHPKICLPRALHGRKSRIVPRLGALNWHEVKPKVLVWPGGF